MINHALINAMLLLLCSSTSVVARSTPNLRGLVEDEAECTALMKVTHFEDTDDADDETFDIECEMSDNLEIIPIEGLPDHVKKKFKSGEYESAFSVIKANGAKRKGKVFKIPPGKNVSIKKKKRRKKKKNTGDRRLDGEILNTLAIWTKAPDSETSTPMDNGAAGCLTDEIFGTYGDPVNLKSQFNSCSEGKLQFEPVNGVSSTGKTVANGVYKINISQTVNGVDERTVRNEIYREAYIDLGSLSAQYDHVMFCIPPGTSGNWIAYAYINHWLSVYNDQWCNYASAQLHEVGHNLNLAHSGENNAVYADQSGMMGYSYPNDNGPEMCFNAVKHVQLGWFTDREVTLSSSDFWRGNIYGIANYGVTTSDEKMIIRLDDALDTTGYTDFYISYNAKVGINSGTADGADKVLIHSKEGNPDQYGQSWLLRKLTTGGQYDAVMTDRTVPIKVLSINTDASPPYAVVEVGNPPNDSPTASPTSLSSTSSPTDSPTSDETNPPPTPSPVEPTTSFAPSAAPSQCYLPALTPYADSFISEYSPNNNFGLSSTITIKNGNSPFNRRGLMRFDTSEFWLRYENRPQNTARAYLKCHVAALSITNTDFSVTVSRMGSNTWTEYDVKWNNLLTTGQDIEELGPSVVLANPEPGIEYADLGFVTFDITDLIIGDDLLLSISTSLITGSGIIQFSSKEGSNPPEIYFDEPNAPCLSMTPSNTPSEMP